MKIPVLTAIVLTMLSACNKPLTPEEVERQQMFAERWQKECPDPSACRNGFLVNDEANTILRITTDAEGMYPPPMSISPNTISINLRVGRLWGTLVLPRDPGYQELAVRWVSRL